MRIQKMFVKFVTNLNPLLLRGKFPRFSKNNQFFIENVRGCYLLPNDQQRKRKLLHELIP